MSRITLSNVAKKAQVSMTAVSCALRGTGRMNEKTRDEIKRIAAELGYRPNSMVSAIKTGRSYNIGVILNSQGEFANMLLSGVHQGFQNSNYFPIAAYDSEGNVNDLLQNLMDRNVDGILLRPHRDGDYYPNLDLFIKNKVPIIALDCELFQQPSGFVGTEDFAGGQLAAKHFIELGHRRLAYIGVEGSVPSRERSRGFERCIVETEGVNGIIRTIPDYFNYHAEIQKLAKKILTSENPPSAIFAFNDFVAAMVSQVAYQLEKRIPEDLSIIGYGNQQMANYLSPPLTTIEQYAKNIGKTAAEMLVDKLENGKELQQVRLKPDIKIRKSTAQVLG